MSDILCDNTLKVISTSASKEVLLRMLSTHSKAFTFKKQWPRFALPPVQVSEKKITIDIKKVISNWPRRTTSITRSSISKNAIIEIVLKKQVTAAAYNIKQQKEILESISLKQKTNFL
ncbi:hypothetical protein TNCT_276751 [Trichonephila clavata]|uniref:Uncharacterized protein n=1 Tax=Trichonephila clavata TaxID=2740835 RepID=A0A8X6LN02_TRICU|nr:hypothetical protein TNCT_276751 [Trichonephila clavata]